MKKYIIVLIVGISIVNKMSAQNWLWTNSAGGTGDDNGTFICSDPSGNVYMSGLISSTCYFKTDTLIVNGFNDFFIAKYNSSGTELWVKQFGGPNTNMMNIKSESISDIVYDSINNCIYTSGSFYETCNFGTITLYTGTNDKEMFIAKFDLSGACIWAKKYGSMGDDYGAKLAIDLTGNIYMQGVVPLSGYFDNIIVDNGGFLAKYNSSGNCIWAKNIFNNRWAGGQTTYGVTTLKYINNTILMYGLKVYPLLLDSSIAFSDTNYYSHVLSCWDNNGNIKWAKQLAGPFSYPTGKMDVDVSGNIYLNGITGKGGNYALFESDTLFFPGAAYS